MDRAPEGERGTVETPTLVFPSIFEKKKTVFFPPKTRKKAYSQLSSTFGVAKSRPCIGNVGVFATISGKTAKKRKKAVCKSLVGGRGNPFSIAGFHS